MCDFREKIAWAMCQKAESYGFRGTRNSCSECDHSYRRVRQKRTCHYYKEVDAALKEVAEWMESGNVTTATGASIAVRDLPVEKVADALRSMCKAAPETCENHGSSKCESCE